MIGHLYRYPHPHDSTKFIYVGQGPKRDSRHRAGKTSFGRRFKKLFPNAELTQPIREVVEVRDYLELNELETIWMFRFHTWRGYVGGMNISLPGSADYEMLGFLGGRANVESGHWGNVQKLGARLGGLKASESGRLSSVAALGRRTNVESGQVQAMGRDQGRRNFESGHLSRIGRLGGLKMGSVAGRKSKEDKTGIFGLTEEQRRINALKGNAHSIHIRWHVSRGVSKPDTCILCAEKSNEN